MARRRRTAEEAREEILDAAERLFLAQGPDGVRLKKVAAEVGISHPGVLHHFRSADALVAALHQRASAQIREQFFGLLGGDDPDERGPAVAAALEALADPSKGRLLAWVVAAGSDPFPPARERGLEAVAASLQGRDEPTMEGRFKVQLAVLAMLGDSMLGAGVRTRLGLAEASGPAFRRWLIGQLLT
ncbi:MAG: helix-turn-helix transcriptional regulator [Proteobacteria bacterium]|nr:helix-turn-helix transcriptional regulator [Pseudomonadota bacterium]